MTYTIIYTLLTICVLAFNRGAHLKQKPRWLKSAHKV